MPRLNMVNKVHGKWLCAAANTHFHVWGGFLHYVLTWYFTVFVIPSATAVGAALTAVPHLNSQREVGFCWGFYFLFKTLKRKENK